MRRSKLNNSENYCQSFRQNVCLFLNRFYIGQFLADFLCISQMLTINFAAFSGALIVRRSRKNVYFLVVLSSITFFSQCIVSEVIHIFHECCIQFALYFDMLIFPNAFSMASQRSLKLGCLSTSPSLAPVCTVRCRKRAQQYPSKTHWLPCAISKEANETMN